jgi:hypothetical protein
MTDPHERGFSCPRMRLGTRWANLRFTSPFPAAVAPSVGPVPVT